MFTFIEVEEAYSAPPERPENSSPKAETTLPPKENVEGNVHVEPPKSLPPKNPLNQS
jgi:hypothetical protein